MMENNVKQNISISRGYSQSPDQNDFYFHNHDLHEIFFLISGRINYNVEGAVYPLRSGDFLLIRKGEKHTPLIFKDTPYHKIVIYFDDEHMLDSDNAFLRDFLHNHLRERGCYYSSGLSKQNRWNEYIDKICQTEKESSRRLYLTVLLTELAEHYLREDTQKEDYDNVYDVIAYIDQHFMNVIDIDKICDEFYISKSHLNRKFKQYTNYTLGEYVRNKRLELARNLLQNGVYPNIVSENCGFSDYNAFYKAYRSRYHVSPREHFLKNQ